MLIGNQLFISEQQRGNNSNNIVYSNIYWSQIKKIYMHTPWTQSGKTQKIGSGAMFTNQTLVDFSPNLKKQKK